MIMKLGEDFFELLAYDYLSRSFAWGGAFATGYGAVAFGGRRYDDAENPERHASEANGPQSFAANAGSRANGPWGSALGKETESNGGGSHSRGGGTEAGVSYEFFIKFFSLEDNEESLSLYKEALVRSNTTLHTTADKAGYKYWFADASGEATKAYARASCAKNLWTEAWGDGSSAEGAFTKSIGYAAHSEGGRYYMNGTEEDVADDTKRTIARGDYSHAQNKWTHADGEGSHSEGWGTIAKADFQHVQGRFNKIDLEGRYVHIVGWGNNDSDRRNIHTIDRYGNAVFSGEVYSAGGRLASRNYVDHGLSEKAPSDSVERLAKRITNLEAGIGPDYQVTDTGTAHIKTVPEGALPYAEIEAIGGMTYRKQNLFNFTALEGDDGGDGALTCADGTITIDYFEAGSMYSTEATTEARLKDIAPDLEVGKTYTLSWEGAYGPGDGVSSRNALNVYGGTITGAQCTFTATEQALNYPLFVISWYLHEGDGYTYANWCAFTKIMLNEGSTAQAYEPYGTVRLVDTPATALVSLDENGNELGRIDIPAEVQVLDGYGKGIPDDACNTIEWGEEGNAVFINRLSNKLSTHWSIGYYAPTGEMLIAVGAHEGNTVNTGAERVLCNKFPFRAGPMVNKGRPGIYKAGAGINIFPGKEYTAETWAAQLAEWEAEGDPLVIYYKRAKPVVTDVSAYFSEDNLMPVDGGGTITAVNEHSAAVPLPMKA